MAKVLMIHDVNSIEPSVAIVDRDPHAIEGQLAEWSREWDMEIQLIAEDLTFYDPTELPMERKVTYE